MALDLTRIRALAKAATKGPWELCDFNEGCDPPQPLWGVVNPPYSNPIDHPDEEAAEIEIHVGCREDAEFIAAARSAVPAMCDEIEELRQRVAELEAPEPWDSKANAAEILHPWKTATDNSEPRGFRHRENPDVPLVIMPVARLNQMLREHVEMGAKAGSEETVRLVQQLIAEETDSTGEAVKAT